MFIYTGQIKSILPGLNALFFRYWPKSPRSTLNVTAEPKSFMKLLVAKNLKKCYLKPYYIGIRYKKPIKFNYIVTLHHMSMRKLNLLIMSRQNFSLKMNINTPKQQTRVFKIYNITCIHIGIEFNNKKSHHYTLYCQNTLNVTAELL